MKTMLLLFILLAGFFLLPQHVFAREWTGCVVNNVATLDCIPIVFENIINAALAFAGVVALIMIIFSGIRYVTSGGDPKAVEGARNTLTWAIIGLVVIVLAYLIINFISVFTGVQCINFFGFDNCPV